jgi:light-regulated signal transduction histidine kinase (bacteriophytochrome)
MNIGDDFIRVVGRRERAQRMGLKRSLSRHHRTLDAFKVVASHHFKGGIRDFGNFMVCQNENIRSSIKHGIRQSTSLRTPQIRIP